MSVIFWASRDRGAERERGRERERESEREQAREYALSAAHTFVQWLCRAHTCEPFDTFESLMLLCVKGLFLIELAAPGMCMTFVQR